MTSRSKRGTQAADNADAYVTMASFNALAMELRERLEETERDRIAMHDHHFKLEAEFMAYKAKTDRAIAQLCDIIMEQKDRVNYLYRKQDEHDAAVPATASNNDTNNGSKAKKAKTTKKQIIVKELDETIQAEVLSVVNPVKEVKEAIDFKTIVIHMPNPLAFKKRKSSKARTVLINALLKHLDIKDDVFLFSMIGNALLHIIVPESKEQEIVDKIRGFKMKTIDSFKPFAVPQHGRLGKEEIKLITIKRLAYMYQKAVLLNLKNHIIKGLDPETKELVLKEATLFSFNYHKNIDKNQEFLKNSPGGVADG